MTNEGPSTATGVVVTDALPEGVDFESATPSQGSYDPASGIWSVGEVAPGVTPTLRLQVTVGRTAGATNTAEVTAVDQPDADSTPGNGVPGEDDIASVAFVTRVADLSLTKTADTTSPNRNETVQFTVTLSNAGPDDATEITIRDLLPNGLTLDFATVRSGTYDPAEGLWSVPALAADETATLEITASAVSPGPVVNTAEIIAAGPFDPDSTPGNAVEDEDDLATKAFGDSAFLLAQTGAFGWPGAFGQYARDFLDEESGKCEAPRGKGAGALSRIDRRFFPNHPDR